MESLCKPRVEPNDGATRAEANLFAFCRVVTEFEELKLFELYRGAVKFRLKQNNGNFPILAYGDGMENVAKR